MKGHKAESPPHGKNPVFLPCLLGPTGAGKSAAALALADLLPLSVINADSRQIYRDFPIITAQPTDDEKARCPHLLYGFLPTGDKLGAGGYARLAQLAIEKTHAEGRQALCVGGSGLYFRALLEGLAQVPKIPED
ncbi:MAG: tRNA (adenosine(37)-N6)-dimethylallyltransferase MiaA, partial [Desulfovibrio sp.]|nr:tRNA (adenosine(37)-N6)-dimethylallyltransferase MiaA [Desulfovibrio sp.]